jgi:hypothetical protein
MCAHSKCQRDRSCEGLVSEDEIAIRCPVDFVARLGRQRNSKQLAVRGSSCIARGAKAQILGVWSDRHV